MATKNRKNNTLTREEKIAQKIAENKERILEAHKKHGLNITKVCKAVGIDRSTYYRYRDEDKDFSEACIEACEVVCDEAEETIVKLMRKSPVDKVKLDAAKSLLNARAKDRGWGVERREQKHSGELNVTTQVIRVSFPSNATERTGEAPLPPSWETNTSLHEPC